MEVQTKRHNDELLKTLVPGDLVEIPKTGYSHWAVYTGKIIAMHDKQYREDGRRFK